MVISYHNPVIGFVQFRLIILALFLLLFSESILAATCARDQGATAIPVCRQALQDDPQDVGVLVEYADILMDLDRPQEAIDLLEASFGKNPTNHTIRLKLSNAREAATVVVQDTGPNERTLQRLSALRCNTRTGQAALDACNAALKNQPGNVDFLQAKGDALMLLKQPAEAARAYDLALAQDGNNSAVQSKLKLAVAEIPKEDEQSTPVQNTSQRAQKQSLVDRTPPAHLKRVAEAYFTGDYETVTNLVEPESYENDRVKIQALLFRAAANHKLYVRSGELKSMVFRQIQIDIRAIKKMNPGFSPYIAAFSPRFLTLFKQTG